jgi:PncC family amidohydrolase
MSTKTTAIEIVDIMRAHGLRLCFAESCTAGGIPKVVTSIPGASDVFLGGLTAYHDAALRRIVGGVFDEHGGVSEEVTMALATQGLYAFAGDICVATTGYLGPFEDDRPDHHEGWVAVEDKDGHVLTARTDLQGRREANRQAMLKLAFDTVLIVLKRKVERVKAEPA